MNSEQKSKFERKVKSLEDGTKEKKLASLKELKENLAKNGKTSFDVENIKLGEMTNEEIEKLIAAFDKDFSKEWQKLTLETEKNYPSDDSIKNSFNILTQLKDLIEKLKYINKS